MINYCVNIQKKVKKDNQENYELIKELIEGTLISLVYNMDQKYFEYKKEFAKPDIFIDTNLLIYFLGYQFEEFTESAKELLNMLEEWNFKLNVFNNTVDELTRVLYFCTTKKANYSKDALVNTMCSYFKKQGFKKHDIIEIIININTKISDLKINIVENNIDLNNFNYKTIEKMRTVISGYRPKKKGINKDGKIEIYDGVKAIDHDVSILLKIKEIRGQEPILSFEDAKAIFLTADQGLVNYNWKMHEDKPTIPEVYLDRFITELLWLKDPKSDIKVETLIATCLRDSFIHPNIWQYFIDLLNQKFLDPEKIERFLTSFLSNDIIECLWEMTPDDMSEVEKLVKKHPYN